MNQNGCIHRTFYVLCVSMKLYACRYMCIVYNSVCYIGITIRYNTLYSSLGLDILCTCCRRNNEYNFMLREWYKDAKVGLI